VRHDLFSERFQEFVAGLDRPAQRLTVANLGQEKIDPPKDGFAAANN
jgi:hypothetical protein